MRESVLGTCRLCHEVQELQDSHTLLPAGVYRRLRSLTAKNPNPVLLTEGLCVSTSRQAKEHLLCRDCEDRFNRNGEKWVLENCIQLNNAFPLRVAVQSGTQCSSGEVIARTGMHIDTDKLAYFAASIFWRASICTKSYDYIDRPVRLGKYAEDFRLYLLGKADFPTNAALTVSVSASVTEWAKVAWTPTGARMHGIHVWRFVIPGIIFDLFVGKILPLPIRSLCMVRSPYKLIMVTDKVDRSLARATLDFMNRDMQRQRVSEVSCTSLDSGFGEDLSHEHTRTQDRFI